MNFTNPNCDPSLSAFKVIIKISALDTRNFLVHAPKACWI